MAENHQPRETNPRAKPGLVAGSSGRRDLREIREALLLLHQQLDAFQAHSVQEHDDWEEERLRLQQERDELRMQVEALRQQVEGRIPPTVVESPPEATVPLAETERAQSVPVSPVEPAIATRPLSTAPMSSPLMIGWICLFAGTAVHLLTPQVLPGVMIPLFLALLLGIVTLFRRRSALVYGLIVLAVATPAAILWAEATLGFNGLLAPPRGADVAVAAAPAGTAPPRSPIAIGESAVVDGIRIRFDQVSVESVPGRDVRGDPGSAGEPYLRVDLTLSNEGARRIFAKKPWEQSRLIDDRDHDYRMVDPQPSGLDRFGRALNLAELESGAPVSDRMVFPMPPADAASFLVVADPGFYVAADDGLLKQASADPISLIFSRDDIQPR